ncbi:MAG: NAD(P)/FAD-dependent oxidoreductase [Janthinobacterium lividum]
MAGHFDFEGISVERFYHFICKTDEPLFELLRELGIFNRMRWRETSMGFFNEGRLHPWGDPLSLLRFPSLSILSKIRYGLFAFVCVRRNRWDAIENETAKSWITRWCGLAVYERFWRPLLQHKFHEYSDTVSAQWIWTRIRRIGRSRKSLLQEELGYLEGGSKTLIDALADAIESRGGKLHLGEAALEVTSVNGKVTGVRTSKGFLPADFVISTMPTPLVSQVVPSLPDDWKARYDAIQNIGVICVVLKLRRSVTPHFWVNIAEDDMDIPGVIEFTNLRNVGEDTIVYVPYYMPVTHEKFSWPEDRLLDEAFGCLQRLNPKLQADDVLSTRVARLRHGQPVCDAGFAAKVPPIQTPIHGLQIADTCFYYPEDRGLSESIYMGCDMARALAGPLVHASEAPAGRHSIPMRNPHPSIMEDVPVTEGAHEPRFTVSVVEEVTALDPSDTETVSNLPNAKQKRP